jgi:hypothetical protein
MSCRADGSLRWSDTGNNLTSMGSATFSYGWLLQGDSWRINSETSQVLKRQVSRSDSTPSEGIPPRITSPVTAPMPAPGGSGNPTEPTPPGARPDSAAAFYMSRYYLAGFLLRAAKVCGGDTKRTIDAAFNLLGTPELEKMSKAYPDTTEQWMLEGGNNLNTGVMKEGIERTCDDAMTVRAKAEEIAKADH